MTVQTRPDPNELTPATVERLVIRMLQDALNDANELYWLRRARAFDAVPDPETAQACRNRARFLRMTRDEGAA